MAAYAGLRSNGAARVDLDGTGAAVNHPNDRVPRHHVRAALPAIPTSPRLSDLSVFDASAPDFTSRMLPGPKSSWLVLLTLATRYRPNWSRALGFYLRLDIALLIDLSPIHEVRLNRPFDCQAKYYPYLYDLYEFCREQRQGKRCNSKLLIRLNVPLQVLCYVRGKITRLKEQDAK
jgi:hypothetical protein